jgi:hypothetical protein
MSCPRRRINSKFNTACAPPEADDVYCCLTWEVGRPELRYVRASLVDPVWSWRAGALAPLKAATTRPHPHLAPPPLPSSPHSHQHFSAPTLLQLPDTFLAGTCGDRLAAAAFSPTTSLLRVVSLTCPLWRPPTCPLRWTRPSWSRSCFAARRRSTSCR